MRRMPATIVCAVVIAAVLGAASDAPQQGTNRSWPLDDVLTQLQASPRDPFLQYVALQLAWRKKDLARVQPLVEKAISDSHRGGRARDADLFSLFTGALAVQESLQLDVIAGPASSAAFDPPDIPRAPVRADAHREQHARELIPISTLGGPTVKSHPWEAMLAGRKPAISPLALCVPDDFYFLEFRSASKLLDLLEQGDLWATHLASHAVGEARSQRIRQRLQMQLAIETSTVLRPFYDLAIDGVAITGSDLAFAEGADVTILFHAPKPELVKNRLDAFLKSALQSHPDARTTNGKILGIDFTHVSTPDRAVHAFAAQPRSDLFVRSNSRIALERVLAAVTSQPGARRLGDSSEFAYVRTLFPTGAPQEDGFAYLSDPFIRHLVGPVAKLTERRRVLCYNHIRMIGHSALLYRLEHGRPPKSLDELADSRCCPGNFNADRLRCPDGGTYVLDADGLTGHCTHHGHAQSLVPDCEIPLSTVTQTEAGQYADFVKEYNQYWRTFFDPIALRIQIRPDRYRVETVILPLIDNSIYTAMARVLGGTPEPLDALPVPKRNFFTLAFRINKLQLLKEFELADGGNPAQLASARNADTALALRQANAPLGLPAEVFDKLNIRTLLNEGVGNQIAFHLYDSPPPIDVNVPMLAGWMLGQGVGHPGAESGRMIGELPAILPIAGLLHPVYVSVPVRNRGIVDDFLNRLDRFLAAEARVHRRDWFIEYASDFYKLTSAVNSKEKFRVAGLRFGPIKVRLFWARIGDGLYLATQPFILEDLVALETQQPPRKAEEAGPAAHGLFRIRAGHWNELLPADRLGWAESNREACLQNIGPLSSVLRALSTGEIEGRQKQLADMAGQVMDVEFYCPEGGHYDVTPDGRAVRCSVHGSPADSYQSDRPAEGSEVARLMRNLNQFTASLTIQRDGLFACLEIDRKP